MLVRSTAVTESEWTELDRDLLLALRAEQAETCSMCGHPLSVCRDPNRRWTVKEDICQPSRVAQAMAENAREAGKRGVVLLTQEVT